MQNPETVTFYKLTIVVQKEHIILIDKPEPKVQSQVKSQDLG